MLCHTMAKMELLRFAGAEARLWAGHVQLGMLAYTHHVDTLRLHQHQ